MSQKKRNILFVGGLDEQIGKEILYEAFLPFGDIVDVEIPIDPNHGGTHRGFGFVEFADPADAKAAIDNMHLSEIYGRTLKVNVAKPMRNREYSNRPVWEDEEFLQRHAEHAEEERKRAAASGDDAAPLDATSQLLKPVTASAPAQEV